MTDSKSEEKSKVIVSNEPVEAVNESVDDGYDPSEFDDFDDLGLVRPQADRLTLDWLVDDFAGISESVYEAAMVSARRARQVGVDQKMEIDRWNITHDITEPGTLPDENAEQGIDHFHHPKPTVQAMHELKNKELIYHYPDEEEK